MTANSPLTAVPAGTANGTALAEPDNASSILFYLPAGSSVTFTIKTDQPSAPPAEVITYDAAEVRRAEEPLSLDQHVYVTAITGNPLYRFI